MAILPCDSSLIAIRISEWSFFCIHISQGSVVTCLKRGGIFKPEFVANLLPSRLVKFFFENRIIVNEVMAKSLVSCFLDSRCIIIN